MFAFEVSVNGKKLFVAGAPPGGVLSSMLSWTCRHPERLQFHVGGLPGDGSQDHIEWKTPQIGVGDEIVIRITDSDATDEPHRRYQPGRSHEES